MEQANLFSDGDVKPSNNSEVEDPCRFPAKSGISAYSYGCRCSKCRRAKSQANHRARQTGTTREQCAFPGCENLRRRRQGAKFCEEHATSIHYQHRRQHPPEFECPNCGEVSRDRRNRTNPLCAPCNRKYRGVINSAKRHHVDVDTLVQWIKDPRCQLCEAPIYLGKRSGSGSGGPHVDHDHRCCGEGNSCGRCVRGMLCPGCNMAIGHIERLLDVCDAERITQYLDSGQNPR